MMFASGEKRDSPTIARGGLLPQFGDRQIWFFRNKRPNLVLMLGQGIAPIAAEFSRLGKCSRFE